MARNQEKAQTMLARWLRYKEEETKGPKKRRPYLAELCDDLHEAEKWRGTIIKDISRNVAEIQNASLGEHRIRDLNDRINKLFREKRHWERRIKTLGGKDYKYSSKGYGGYGHGAYLYFGAAKDLPGVRDLLKNEENESKQQKLQKENSNCDRVTGKAKRSRMEMYQMINADYYGFGDEADDGNNNELFWKEKKMEKKLRNAKIERWKRENMEKWEELQNKLNENQKKRKRVTKVVGHVPSQKEIDEIILQKRKEMLLAKYVKNDGSTEEAKQLAKSIQNNQKNKA